MCIHRETRESDEPGVPHLILHIKPAKYESKEIMSAKWYNAGGMMNNMKYLCHHNADCINILIKL